MFSWLLARALMAQSGTESTRSEGEEELTGEAQGKRWDRGRGAGRLGRPLSHPLRPASGSLSGGRSSPGQGGYRMTETRTRVKWSEASLARSGRGKVPGMRARDWRRSWAGSQEGLQAAPHIPCHGRWGWRTLSSLWEA